MERLEIFGGKRLKGKIMVESAKNAILPMIAGAILTDEEVIIENCPKIKDVYSMIDILTALGVKAYFQENNLIINSKNIDSCIVDKEHSKKLRSSVFLLGALLSRFKRAEISLPGGCDIGARNIDLHLSSLKKLGAKIDIKDDTIYAKCDKVKGNLIILKYPSVGATENIMLASVFCKGETIIRNCAKEPEIEDLMKFLNNLGAKIYGGGTGTIIIDGVEKLHGGTFKPMGDRIEAGTYLLAAAITGGEIEISNVKAQNIVSLMNKLCNNACKFKQNNDIIYYKSRGVVFPLDISTGPFPDFPTDLQCPMMAYLTVACGKSSITENVFEKRFEQVSDFVSMGADVLVKDRTAIIKGVKNLHGANVFAKDLRGGAGLVLAALKAEGKSSVYGLEYIDRGYYNLAEKLSLLGANVKRF